MCHQSEKVIVRLDFKQLNGLLSWLSYKVLIGFNFNHGIMINIKKGVLNIKEHLKNLRLNSYIYRKFRQNLFINKYKRKIQLKSWHFSCYI